MARPPLYISRADLEWGASPAASADPRSGLVVHYDGSDQGLPGGDLDDFLDYWRATRSFHTGPSRGWADIGYSFAATPQGYVVEGRGLYREQAAQPGGNRSHYSVTLGLGPGEAPTAAQIDAVRWLRQWLMQDHHVAGKVLGHRDFISTSCPGDRAYALVRDGIFEQPPGAITTEEDDMLGLKLGDSGPRVKLLQLMIKNCGFGDAVGAIDSDYGPATAEGLRLCRDYVGSAALPHYGNEVTPDALEQLHRAHARYTAERYGQPSGGGGSVDPGALVGATLTTKVTKVVS